MIFDSSRCWTVHESTTTPDDEQWPLDPCLALASRGHAVRLFLLSDSM